MIYYMSKYIFEINFFEIDFYLLFIVKGEQN